MRLAVSDNETRLSRRLTVYDSNKYYIHNTLLSFYTMAGQQWRRQDLLRGWAKLEIMSLTTDFRDACRSCSITNTFVTGADPAIGGPGGRLPLWAALSEKTNEIWSVDSQENR